MLVQRRPVSVRKFSTFCRKSVRCASPLRSKKPNQRKKRWSGFCCAPLHCPPWPAALFVRRVYALNVVFEVLRLKGPAAIKFRSKPSLASMLVWLRPRPPNGPRAGLLASLLVARLARWGRGWPARRFFCSALSLLFCVLTPDPARFLVSYISAGHPPQVGRFASDCFYFLTQPPQGKPKFLSPRTPLTPWLAKIRSGDVSYSGGENHLIYLVKNSNSPLGPLLVFCGWSQELTNKPGPRPPQFVGKKLRLASLAVSTPLRTLRGIPKAWTCKTNAPPYNLRRGLVGFALFLFSGRIVLW